MIETKEIRMAPKQMLTVLFLQYGMPWLWVSLAGIIVFIVLGAVVDLRFFVLALIWIFLVLPLMMAFLYFFYGMEPLTVFNSIPHRVRFEDGNLFIHVVRKGGREEEKEETETNEDREENEGREYQYNGAIFDKLNKGGDYIILSAKKQGWLWLPYSGFENIEQLNTIVENYYGKR